MSEPKICEEGGGGLILPLFGDDEQQWPEGLRIILYMLGLAWCFMGVAIVSDVFMGAIECITSKRTRKFNPETQRYITVQVWNPTVANLTLMALGSSAPEILLSVIELLGNSIFSGDLGPSTIVGSAAFNLLCIMAVCVVAIPNGQVRKIKETSVYGVTATCSIWAYIWLLVILLGISPNVVEIWEGVLTFLMFPVLVSVAFAADKGFLSKRAANRGRTSVATQDMTKEEFAELEARVRQKYHKQHGKTLTDDQVARIILVEHANPSTRAQYRVAAVRCMVGGKRVRTSAVGRQALSLGHMIRGLTTEGWKSFCVTSSQMTQFFGGSPSSRKKIHPIESDDPTASQGTASVMTTATERQMVFEFQLVKQAVLESMNCVTINVMRSGQAVDVAGSICFKTREGSAKSPEDFVHNEGKLDFAKGEDLKSFSVKITDDTAFEDDEDFFVDLINPTVEEKSGEPDDVVRALLGEKSTITVVIIDDDSPGILAFPKEELSVAEGVDDIEVDVMVLRKNGCTGAVTCKYHTEDATAIAGIDYEETQGMLKFDSGQLEGSFKVMIRSRGRYERKEYFRVILKDPTDGLKFDAQTDGGEDSCILSLFIEPKAVAKARIDRLVSSLQVDWEKAKLSHGNWCEQFRAAVLVNGGEDCDPDNLEAGEEGSGEPTKVDYVMHAITVPWKLLFALVPPVDYCGGWACFCCSLMMIGLVTAVIGDVAGLLGCVMGIRDCVTAITFVALGTSLPDTFASKTAAVQDPYADASIGNVTGSNSVNVFLGLGLPWMLGAIFWTAGGANDDWNDRFLLDPDIAGRHKEGAFVVKAGDLGFSVMVFTCCAITAMFILYIRRRLFGGELGGPVVQKYATAGLLVCLWLLYVSLSAWKCS